MAERVRAYLASPLGFAASTKGFMESLEALLCAVVIVENPWKLGGLELDEAFRRAYALPGAEERAAALHQINQQIAAGNEAAIRRADLLIAVLDGVDVDSGTASEIGFAYGLGKRSYGLRTDTRLAGDNPGAKVNLQVEYWIETSGGAIVERAEQLIELLAAM